MRMRAIVFIAFATISCAASGPMVRADPNTVADRIRAARPGDTIALAPGEYRGGWWIETSGMPGRPVVITTLGPPGSVVVRGGDEGINIAHGAHDLVIENLEVRDSRDNLIHIQGGAHDIVLRRLHVHHAGPDGDGVKVNQSHDVWIEALDCHHPGPRPDRPDGNPSQECVDLVDVQRVVVRDSFLHDGGNQLLFVKGGSRDVVIERNVFTRQGPDAIDPCVGLGGSTDPELLHGRRYEASDVVFRNNVVADCRAGGIGVYDAERVWIVNNTLVDVGTDGVQFRAGNGAAEASRGVHIVNDWFVQTGNQPFAPWVVRSHGIADIDVRDNALAARTPLRRDEDETLAAALDGLRHTAVPDTLPDRWSPDTAREWAGTLRDAEHPRGVVLRGAGHAEDDQLEEIRPTNRPPAIGAFEPESHGSAAVDRARRTWRWPSAEPETDSGTRVPPRARGGGPHAGGCAGGCSSRARGSGAAMAFTLAFLGATAQRKRERR